jgi:hypothetical protein
LDLVSSNSVAFGDAASEHLARLGPDARIVHKKIRGLIPHASGRFALKEVEAYFAHLRVVGHDMT